MQIRDKFHKVILNIDQMQHIHDESEMFDAVFFSSINMSLSRLFHSI